MSIRIEKKDNIAKVFVEGELTIYTAGQFKGPLLDALVDCIEIDIDLSHVVEMDTAGLQILLLARREAVRGNKAVRIAGHGDASLDVFQQYNISQYFNTRIETPL